MVDLMTIVKALDEELRTSEIPDYGGALNGLQLENNGEVTRVALAVDASLAVIEEAVSVGADLLIVHHGLFWQGAQRITAGVYKKLNAAMSNNLAVYSSHLPLDIHPKLGNNAVLAEKIGLESPEPFFDWKGIQLGLVGDWSKSWEQLVSAVEQEVGILLTSHQEREKVGRLGVITGGAGSEVQAVRDCGIDTFLSGEGPHWSFPLAQEIGLSYLLAGHYATEVFGVNALGKFLTEIFQLPVSFLDHPTQL